MNNQEPDLNPTPAETDSPVLAVNGERFAIMALKKALRGRTIHGDVAPGRFCSFGPASTTFVRLYTLYMYCT